MFWFVFLQSAEEVGDDYDELEESSGPGIEIILSCYVHMYKNAIPNQKILCFYVSSRNIF